ncbi:oligosaccharide flippase family protein [Pseudomonas stutzeri]|nr:oligosaccharide flippase family protein [Stutzerimonas stutzeri]
MIRQLTAGAGRLLPKAPFARSVGVLVGGTAGGQMLMVLAAPLLTRLFSPEDFGLLAVYGGLLALFLVVANLRYEIAIPLPEDEQVAANVTVLCLLAATLSSLLSGVLVYFAGDGIAARLGVPELAAHLWLLPLGVFFGGIYLALNYWAVRHKQFGDIAATRIKQISATLAIQLLGFKLGPVALLLGHASGHGAGSLALGRNFLRSPQLRQVSVAGILAAARRYRRFPLFSTWAGLFNTAGTQLPPLLLAALFSPVAAGLYTLAQRVLGAPMAVIGNAIGGVFLANATEARREGRLAPLVAQVHERLAQIAMPAALVILLAAPALFSLVFGEEWHDAGHFAQWMAPWLYVTFVASPLSSLFDVLEQQKLELRFHAVLLVTRIGSIMLGALLDDLETTIALFSLSSALCWGGALLWINRAAGNSLGSLLRPTGHALLWSAACVLPLLIATAMFPGHPAWLLFLAITAVSIGGRYFVLLRATYR